VTDAQAAVAAVVAAAGAGAVALPGSAPRLLSGRLSVRRPGPAADGPVAGRDPARGPVGRAPTDRRSARIVVVVALLATAAAIGVTAAVAAGATTAGAAGNDLAGTWGGASAVVVRSGLPGAAPALAVVALVVVRARRRSRQRRSAVTARRLLVRATEVLAAELRVGATPLDALGVAAAELPALGPVASAGRLGADVPTGLSELATRPGLAGLRHLAAAWAVSAEVGAALAGTVDRLTDALRDDDATREETEVALATPRATGRLLAILPAAGLGLGTVIGADPWQVLTGSPAGAALGCGGALLAGAGLEWVELLADRVDRAGSVVAPGRRDATPARPGRRDATPARPRRRDATPARPRRRSSAARS